jgi:hypothetical protein
MLLMAVRMPMIMFFAGAAAGAGTLAFLVFGESWPAFAAGAWCVLVGEIALLLILCASALRRFDVSLETPGE